MLCTIQPICGVQVGIEFTEQEIAEGHEIGYCLIDVFIVRFQIAWYRGEK